MKLPEKILFKDIIYFDIDSTDRDKIENKIERPLAIRWRQIKISNRSQRI